MLPSRSRRTVDGARGRAPSEARRWGQARCADVPCRCRAPRAREHAARHIGPPSPRVRRCAARTKSPCDNSEASASVPWYILSIRLRRQGSGTMDSVGTIEAHITPLRDLCAKTRVPGASEFTGQSIGLPTALPESGEAARGPSPSPSSSPGPGRAIGNPFDCPVNSEASGTENSDLGSRRTEPLPPYSKS